MNKTFLKEILDNMGELKSDPKFIERLDSELTNKEVTNYFLDVNKDNKDFALGAMNTDIAQKTYERLSEDLQTDKDVIIAATKKAAGEENVKVTLDEPTLEEEVTVEETPAVEEAVVEETPAIEEAPVVEEASAVEEDKGPSLEEMIKETDTVENDFNFKNNYSEYTKPEENVVNNEDVYSAVNTTVPNVAFEPTTEPEVKYNMEEPALSQPVNEPLQTAPAATTPEVEVTPAMDLIGSIPTMEQQNETPAFNGPAMFDNLNMNTPLNANEMYNQVPEENQMIR